MLVSMTRSEEDTVRARKPRHAARRVASKIRHFTATYIDMLSEACMHLQTSPRHVFLMMQVCRGLRANLHAQWWQRFWTWHQSSLRHIRHHYLNEGIHGTLRAPQYTHIFRLVYGLRCERCHARWHHRVIPLLNMRLCPLCVRDNLVSNRVLLFRYGLRACDVLEAHAHLITYFPLTAYRRRERALRDLTQDPIDLQDAFSRSSRTQQFMFLWRPDLEALYDLDACAAEQRRRLDATNRLKAAMRRLNVHLYTNCTGRPLDPHSRLLEAYASGDGTVLQPPPEWIPGSPHRISWIPQRRSSGVIRVTFERNTSHKQRALWNLMQAHAPRPLLGFNEVCAKTWLETFQGPWRPPVPDDERPRSHALNYPTNNVGWTFSRNVYDTRTLRRIAPA